MVEEATVEEVMAAAVGQRGLGNVVKQHFPSKKELSTVNDNKRRNYPRVAACLLWLLPCIAGAQNLTIDPPGERAFVQDLARMVQPDDVMAIRGGAGWRIETFARVLFDQWGIGYETIEGQPWNRGVLLLVSKDDRKARIELGNDWAGAYDPICRKIMDSQIIPNFKKGKFSEGILAGVQELDKMCRSIPVPAEIVGGGNSGAPAAAGGAQGPSSTHGSNLSLVNRDIKLSPPVRPDWFWPAVGVTVFLAIFTAVSMIRSGSSGWAWALWAVVFGVIGFILYTVATSSGRHSRGGFGGGGGGFSGGSFGGGFGGGGGATGSW